jgi:hypothetical protein
LLLGDAAEIRGAYIGFVEVTLDHGVTTSPSFNSPLFFYVRQLKRAIEVFFEGLAAIDYLYVGDISASGSGDDWGGFGVMEYIWVGGCVEGGLFCRGVGLTVLSAGYVYEREPLELLFHAPDYLEEKAHIFIVCLILSFHLFCNQLGVHFEDYLACP